MVPRRIALAVLAGTGLLLAAILLRNMVQDALSPQSPLWSTLAENALPLFFALLLPAAAVRLGRSDREAGYVSETAIWAVAGGLATLLVASIGVGLQSVQGRMQPLMIVVQMATFGATGGLLLGVNVAEIRQARAALETREYQFRSIAQNVSDGIFRYSLQGGGGDAEIVYANDAFAGMFGYDDPAEIVGSDPGDFHAGSSLDGTFFQSLEAAGGLDGAVEVTFRRKDGSTFAGLLKSSLVRDEEGDPVYRDGVITDISEQKRRQEDLQAAIAEADEARKEAEAAQEMAERERRKAEQASRSKSRFLAGVAHDLRSPLTVIMGSTRILQAAASGESTEPIRQIRRSAEHISDMMETLDDLAKLQSGQLSLDTDAADVRHPVRDAVESLRPAADESTIDLQLDVPDEPVRALIDTDSTRRVVDNLVGNAIKYGRAGDRVRVGLEAEEGTTAGAATVVLTVADTGPGIEDAFRDDLFEPFARNDDATSGTGLGLSVVKELVEAMDGDVEVQSEVGTGTRFDVRFPGVSS
jgi:PAS domain S-box-containing protein